MGEVIWESCAKESDVWGGKQLITVAAKGIIRTPAGKVFWKALAWGLSGEAEIKQVFIIQWHLPRNRGGEGADRVTADSTERILAWESSLSQTIIHLFLIRAVFVEVYIPVYTYRCSASIPVWEPVQLY